MSKGEIVLLDCWASPFCMRAKIALAEKGVDYEARAENLCGGKTELLLKSNPIYKKVPVLLHDGKPLCESAIIVSYIDETWPSPPLLPPSAFERAKARFWSDFIDKKVFDAICNIWRSSGQVPETARAEFIKILRTLEGALGKKDFFGGDTFGFVDIIAIPLTCWFYAAEKFGGFKVADECPKLTAWMNKCLQRQSVAKVLPAPEKIYEFVIMLRKMHGIE